MKNQLVFVFFHWLPLGIAITFVCAGAYIGIQQNYRMSLNDPQIQMVEDAQTTLMNGKQPQDIVQRGAMFDASKSLAPFLAVYDESGNVLESSAFIGVSAIPVRPPMGIFDVAKKQGENRVTWQPDANTRIALVVRPVAIESGWFVAAGRNMREVEVREDNLTKIFIAAWSLAIGASFFLDIVGDRMRRKAMEKMNK